MGMLLEVEGRQYKITVTDTTKGIHVSGIRDSIVELYVHHRIPGDELLAYLQINHAGLQKEAEQIASSPTGWIEIYLFDKKHIVKQNHKAKTPFLKGTTLFVPRLPQTSKQIEQLKTDILRHQILEMIGFWEERLDFMLDHIVLKTLRNHDYRLSKDKASVTYTKKLVDVSSGILTYIIATSVFDYLGLNTEQRTVLYEKHVGDWKYLMKIYAYEREK